MRAPHAGLATTVLIVEAAAVVTLSITGALLAGRRGGYRQPWPAP
jgi:hypothetical protein